MKIIIKSLKISDIVDKCSRNISFVDGINLITSDSNSRGKSVLMKSIYHSLGADSFFDTNIRQNNILFEIEFEYNGIVYRILRYQDSFCAFKNGSLLKYYPAGDRAELSYFYLNELGMAVFLRSRKSLMEISPPAYMFIPFYLDQDRSWKDGQYPFSRSSMSQYLTTSMNELYYYSLGLYRKEYGLLKKEIDEITEKVKYLENKREKLDTNYRMVKELNKVSHINLSKEEIDNYQRTTINSINQLLLHQNSLILELDDLDKKKIECCIKIKNNKYAISKISNNSNDISTVVTCPNCNNKFDIKLRASVINTYNSVLLENENISLEEEINQISQQIELKKILISKVSEQIEDMRKKTKERTNKYEQYFTWLALSKLCDNQLKQVGDLSLEIERLQKIKNEKSEIKKRIKQSTSDANALFVYRYKSILNVLDIDDFDPNTIKAFYKLSLSGSQYARSTLAFFFAFLYTKNEYNPNDYNWPLVIDSPREGEQDNMNSSKILDFIIRQNISNHQCIVASVNACDYLTEEQLKTINVVKLDNEKNKVMLEEEYDEGQIKEKLSFFSKV